MFKYCQPYRKKSCKFKRRKRKLKKININVVRRQKDAKRGRKEATGRGRKYGFWRPWVGAFSVFSPGHTGTPFIFWPKLPFFAKIGRFRGWCNTTPSTPGWTVPIARTPPRLGLSAVFLVGLVSFRGCSGVFNLCYTEVVVVLVLKK